MKSKRERRECEKNLEAERLSRRLSRVIAETLDRRCIGRMIQPRARYYDIANGREREFNVLVGE